MTAAIHRAKRADFRGIFVAVLAGWLIPGLGHVLVGSITRGVVLFALIGGLYVSGAMMSGWEAVSWPLHPYAFWADAGAGGFTLALHYLNLTRDLVLPPSTVMGHYQLVPPYVDPGVLFCAVAGLLNLLVLFDVVERMLGGPFAKESK
ncbi:MAG: hypothetical protein L0Z55_03395 [Planctomycetes bacterium]|nr:hypothetical protein [Planctomycetota bacterium]